MSYKRSSNRSTSSVKLSACDTVGNASALFQRPDVRCRKFFLDKTLAGVIWRESPQLYISRRCSPKKSETARDMFRISAVDMASS